MGGSDPRIDALFAEWDRPDSPGCAVAVLRHREVIHARGYGMADLEHEVPITPATVFNAGSISKQFTAFAVLLLAAEGKLALDDDVRRYVPEVPAFGARLTLRHCLHHTSGLRDESMLLRLSGWRWADVKSEADVLDLVSRQRALNFEPGDEFSYSNTGYTLLAVTVSRVSGMSLRAFAEARVFAALGMTATRFRDDHTELITARARGYTRDQQGRLWFWVPNADFAGSRSLHTTVRDLLRWAGNLFEPRVGDAAVGSAFRATGTLNDGQPLRYAAGVELVRYRGLPVIKHSGWELGYKAHLCVYPEHDVAIAILGNLSQLLPEALARRVADVYLADQFTEPLAPTVTLPEALLTAKTGLYRHHASGRALWVHAAEGGLRVSSEPAAKPESSILYAALDPARFRDPGETVELSADGTRITFHDLRGPAWTLERVASWAPAPGALEAYTGTYWCPELDVSFTFSVKAGALVARERKWPARALAPAYEDAFTDDVMTYLFTRDAGGAVDGLQLSLDRVRRLRFDRRSDQT